MAATMQNLIDKMNKVHRSLSQAGLTDHLELPQIVVVGSQSVGKSSVLESIVGKNFLPRGKETVTRCPIHIALLPCPDDEEEYGIFVGDGDEKKTDFDSIEPTIREITKNLCTDDMIVSHHPIYLSVHLHNVPSLTLIDLPGLIEISKDGQPEELKQEIEKIVNTHVSNPKAIILAVSAANNDVNNSCALRKAREVDDSRQRTVGVFTKCDLCLDTGSLVKMLRNEEYMLKLGHFAVVCRCQEDSESNGNAPKTSKDLEKARFEDHEFDSVKQQCGIHNMTTFLSDLLHEHVREEIPALMERMKQNLNNLVTKKHEMNMYTETEVQQPNLLCIKLIDVLLKRITSELYGQTNGISMTPFLQLGGELSDLLHSAFKKKLSDVPFTQPSYTALKRSLKNAGGVCPGTLPSDKLVIPILEENIMALEKPVVEFVGEIITVVHQKIDKMIADIAEFKHIPHFRMILKSKIAETVKSIEDTCLQDMKHLVEAEAAYIDMKCSEMEATQLLVFNNTLRPQSFSCGKHERYLQQQKKNVYREPEDDENNIQEIYNEVIKELTENFKIRLATENVKKGIHVYLSGGYDKPFTIYQSFVEFSKVFPYVAMSIVDGRNFSEDEKEIVNFTDDDKKNFFILQAINSSYFTISRGHILNQAPKYVMLGFIRPLVEQLKSRLYYLALNKDETTLSHYLEHTSDYIKKKQEILASEEALQNSIQCLQSELGPE